MLLRLILILTSVPILELFVLLQVHYAVAARWGNDVGLLVTVGGVVLTGVAGAALARQQGMGVLRSIQESMRRGELPGRALVDGVMVLIGAALLLTPGFLTDALGFSFLIPGTRALHRKFLTRWIRKKLRRGEVHFRTSGFHGQIGGPHAHDDD